jgi:hypothetical protein
MVVGLGLRGLFGLMERDLHEQHEPVLPDLGSI